MLSFFFRPIALSFSPCPLFFYLSLVARHARLRDCPLNRRFAECRIVEPSRPPPAVDSFLSANLTACAGVSPLIGSCCSALAVPPSLRLRSPLYFYCDLHATVRPPGPCPWGSVYRRYSEVLPTVWYGPVKETKLCICLCVCYCLLSSYFFFRHDLGISFLPLYCAFRLLCRGSAPSKIRPNLPCVNAAHLPSLGHRDPVFLPDSGELNGQGPLWIVTLAPSAQGLPPPLSKPLRGAMGYDGWGPFKIVTHTSSAHVVLPGAGRTFGSKY